MQDADRIHGGLQAPYPPTSISFSLILTQITADDAVDGVRVGSDDSHAFRVELDKLTSKIQSLGLSSIWKHRLLGFEFCFTLLDSEVIGFSASHLPPLDLREAHKFRYDFHRSKNIAQVNCEKYPDMKYPTDNDSYV
ncbi:hypothetical protein LXL04_018861 [Taraxacum kok-saghyz]